MVHVRSDFFELLVLLLFSDLEQKSMVMPVAKRGVILTCDHPSWVQDSCKEVLDDVYALFMSRSHEDFFACAGFHVPSARWRFVSGIRVFDVKKSSHSAFLQLLQSLVGPGSVDIRSVPEDEVLREQGLLYLEGEWIHQTSYVVRSGQRRSVCASEDHHQVGGVLNKLRLAFRSQRR